MRKEAGVTLTEVMVVVAIIGILAAIAIPNWLSWRANAKINGAATNLRGDLQMAKMRAIKENAPAVALMEAANRYKVFIEQYFTTGAGSPWSYDPSDDILLRSRELAPGVTIDLTEITEIRFSPRGTTEILPPTKTILVLKSTGKQRSLEVNMVGGVKVLY